MTSPAARASNRQSTRYLWLTTFATASSLVYLYTQKKPLLAEAPAAFPRSTNEKRLISAEELAGHTTKESLWVVIAPNVYDVTSWTTGHPGGSELILACGGKEISAAFQKFHPKGTLEAVLANGGIRKVGEIDPKDKLPEVAPVVEDERDIEARRQELPDIDTISNLNMFEQLAKRTLGAHSRGYKYSWVLPPSCS
jgi:cytochrome b involved in lipid metabolism